MAATLGSASGLVPAFLVAALAVRLQRELGFGQAGLGLATGFFFGVAGLAAMAGGRLADRIGWRRAMLAATSCSAAALVGIAVQADSYAELLGWLAVGAVGNAMAQPTSNLILAREFQGGRLGLAFGIKQSSVPLATLLAGGSVPTVAALYGWRPAFAGALVLPVTATLIAVSHRAPSGSRVVSAARTAPRLPGAGRLILGAALASVLVSGVNTFTVVAAVDTGISESLAGTLFAAVSLFGLATRVFLGWQLDRRSTDPMRVVGGLLIVGSVGAALMAVSTPVTFVAGLIVAVAGGWGWGGVFLYGIVRRYPLAPAAATGAVQAGVSVGLATGPFLLGIAADVAGYHLTWLATAVTSAVAAAWIRHAVGARAQQPLLADA